MSVRIIIVDDEYRIGQLISMLIHADELGIEIVHVFSSSTEARDFIVAEHPDIVISDIQMPVMDGLELIRSVKESGENPYFILISGFREFEYARTALKYGVEEYLLKPINEDELNRVLNNVIGKLNIDIEKREETKQLHEMAQRAHSLSGHDALYVLCSGRYEAGIEEFNQSFHVRFRDGVFLPFILQIDHDEPDSVDYLQDRFVLNSAVSMTEEAFSQTVTEHLYTIRGGNPAVGIMNYPASVSEMIHEKLKDHFLTIRAHAEAVPGCHITLALGNECSFENIAWSMQCAEARCTQRILLGTGRVIADTGTDFKPDRNDHLSSGEEQRIQNAAASFNQDELNEIIHEQFVKAASFPAVESMRVITLADNILDCFFRSFPQSSAANEEHRRIHDAVYACFTTEMMEKTMIRELGSYLREKNRSLQAKTRRPIREALDYIAKHYGEKITLESISDMLQMNSSYFSTLFKKETGENFQNYLTAFRIEKAKELLRTTNDTMQSIAAGVGYTDTRYFSQSFTRIVGIKPSLYRKMYS